MIRSATYLLLILSLPALATGCRQDMHDQPRLEPLEASTFFADGRASRPQVEGTMARGQLQEDELFFTGRVGGKLVNELPMPLSHALLVRGRERYEIFCTPCHARTGNGRGMVVQRGFPPAASFHEQRLRDQPVSYVFDVLTNGFGRMRSYAAQIPPADRWAIAAYVRALQLSQNAPVSGLSPEDRRLLDESLQSPALAPAEESHGATP